MDGPKHQHSGEPGRRQDRRRRGRIQGPQEDGHDAKRGKKGDECFSGIGKEAQDIQNQREKQQENESGKGKKGGRQKKCDGEQKPEKGILKKR